MESTKLPYLDELPGEGKDDYDLLPEPIKLSHTRKEFLWLSDTQKAKLIDQECEPEW